MTPRTSEHPAPKRSVSRWLLGAVVAASAVTSLWWLLAPAPATAPDGTPLAEDLAVQPDVVRHALAALPERHLQRAAQGAYRFRAELEVTASAGLAPRTRKLTVEAELALGADPASVGDGWSHGQLRRVRTTGDASLQRELGLDRLSDRPADYAFRTEPHGDAVELRYDAALPRGVRNLLHAATTGLQVTGTPGQGSWQSIERTTDAEVDIAYRQDETGKIHKRWERKASERGGPSGSGEASLEHDALGLRHATYAYALAVDLTLHESVQQQQQVAVQLELKRQVGGQVLKDTKALGELATDEQLAIRERPAPSRPRDSGRSWSQLVDDTTSAGTRRDWQAQNVAKAELKDKVAHDPAALQGLLQALRQPGLQGEALRTLVEALAYANTDAGRLAYASAMQSPDVPYVARHALVSAASFVAEPTEPVLGALRAILTTPKHELQAAAAMAFAAIAHTQVERNTALGPLMQEEVLQRAAVWLAGPEAPKPEIQPEALAHDERDLWIQALGNLGGKAAWPLLAPYLVAQSDWLRLHAIESLRFVQLPAARMALAKAMLLDPRERNRRMAAETAAYHPRSAMQEPVVRALREDPDPVVRIGAAGTVAAWGITSPGLNAEITAAAERENNADVKRILVGLQPQLLVDTTGGHP